MPIEIKELHIKVTVNSPVPTSTLPATNSPAKSGSMTDDLLIAECAEHVMHIIKVKNER